MLTRILLAHPRSVDELFFQHMRFALGVAAALFLAMGAVLIHAFIPCLFEKTASKIIARLESRIQRSKVYERVPKN